MMTTMTLKEWKAEQAGQAAKGLSEHDRLKRLAPGTDRLNEHAWTDKQIQKIPENLAQFAFESSETLRKEFGNLHTFTAYRRACMAGLARVAGLPRKT